MGYANRPGDYRSGPNFCDKWGAKLKRESLTSAYEKSSFKWYCQGDPMDVDTTVGT
jgi:hypothetical protein